jgi:hypothetical protein
VKPPRSTRVPIISITYLVTIKHGINLTLTFEKPSVKNFTQIAPNFTVPGQDRNPCSQPLNTQLQHSALDYISGRKSAKDQGGRSSLRQSFSPHAFLLQSFRFGKIILCRAKIGFQSQHLTELCNGVLQFSLLNQR